MLRSDSTPSAPRERRFVERERRAGGLVRKHHAPLQVEHDHTVTHLLEERFTRLGKEIEQAFAEHHPHELAAAA